MWIYHILLVHSSVDGHLGFHFGAMMSNAAVEHSCRGFCVDIMLYFPVGYLGGDCWIIQ